MYLWLKSLHLIAVISWVGGMLVAAVAVAALSTAQMAPSDRSAAARVVRRWDQRVTSPSMLIAWCLGLGLAVEGAWLSQGWLWTKIAVVLALSALHGMLSGRLRRLSIDGTVELGNLRSAPAAVLAGVAIIVFLVLTKPF